MTSVSIGLSPSPTREILAHAGVRGVKGGGDSMPESMAVPLSADHMSIHNSFGISQNSGGDYSMAMAYLLAWQGLSPRRMILWGQHFAGRPCTCLPRPGDPDPAGTELRRGKTGGVFIWRCPDVLYLPSENRVSDEDVCYKGSEEPNHDAVIIGWDDNYPKEKFASNPESDGAFLCVNSWGENFGRRRLFPCAYEDSWIAESGISYCGIGPADNFDRNYQSDLCGWTGQMGIRRAGAWMANAYTAESDETLEAVASTLRHRTRSMKCMCLTGTASVNMWKIM